MLLIVDLSLHFAIDKNCKMETLRRRHIILKIAILTVMLLINEDIIKMVMGNLVRRLKNFVYPDLRDCLLNKNKLAPEEGRAHL